MAARKARAKSAAPAPSPVWGVCLALLVVAIGYSGIVVVDNAQTMRELYQASGEVQIQNDTALADYSRLTLEVGALTNLQSIEQIATKELGMEFPETIGRVIEQVQQ